MTIGNTAAAFVEKHDKKSIISKKVIAALKQLPKDRWLYEGDFVKLAKLSQGQWGDIAEAYADYIVLAKSIGQGAKRQPRRVVCGSVKFASQLREVASI